MSDTELILAGIRWAHDGLKAFLDCFSVAGTLFVLTIMVGIVSFIPMAFIAGVTTFLAWCVLGFRIVYVYIELVTLTIFDFFFPTYRYPRLGEIDYRFAPPSFDQWCDIVDESCGNPPRRPRWPALPSRIDYDARWANLLNRPHSPSRRRMSTSGMAAPQVYARRNNRFSLGSDDDEYYEIKDYGFPVSPEYSVIDGDGEKDGFGGLDIDPLRLYYARVAERAAERGKRHQRQKVLEAKQAREKNGGR